MLLTFSTWLVAMENSNYRRENFALMHRIHIGMEYLKNAKQNKKI